MTNDELKQRLQEGLPLCDKEHEGVAEPQGGGMVAYALLCDGERLASITLGNAEEPAPWFERWNRQHQYDVTREHLLRVLEGGEITPTWKEATDNRLETLEERWASLDQRLIALDRRTVGSIHLGGLA